MSSLCSESEEDVSTCEEIKKRKTYQISKARSAWTEEEHTRFVEGVEKYERDWKEIEKHVGTKNVIQIRSHAQKYFKKLQKEGKGDTVPPARVRYRKKKHHVGAKNVKKRTKHTEVVKMTISKLSPISKSAGSSDEEELEELEELEEEIVLEEYGMVETNNKPDFRKIYLLIANLFENQQHYYHQIRELNPIDSAMLVLLLQNINNTLEHNH